MEGSDQRWNLKGVIRGGGGRSEAGKDQKPARRPARAPGAASDLKLCRDWRPVSRYRGCRARPGLQLAKDERPRRVSRAAASDGGPRRLPARRAAAPVRDAGPRRVTRTRAAASDFGPRLVARTAPRRAVASGF